ncbi:MAG: hypothetical protein GY765_36645 [bacterium]|nr:hypothetical protein [bacterium]
MSPSTTILEVNPAVLLPGVNGDAVTLPPESTRFLLSFPLRPEFHHKLRRKFQHLPALVLNQGMEIVHGFDYALYALSKSIPAIDALKIDICDKDALFMNYNLKEAFGGINLFEKLTFMKKALAFSNRACIYESVDLDISITPQLIDNLSSLLDEQFYIPLTTDKISLKTALALCSFTAADRLQLLQLFETVAFSSSHQLKIVEITRELVFRDKKPLEDIFKQLDIHGYLELENPRKPLIDALFKYRNPAYSRMEADWQKETAHLPANMKVTHFPFFEKPGVELSVRLKNTDELKEFLSKK